MALDINRTAVKFSLFFIAFWSQKLTLTIQNSWREKVHH